MLFILGIEKYSIAKLMFQDFTSTLLALISEEKNSKNINSTVIGWTKVLSILGAL